MPNPLRSTRGLLATIGAVGVVLALDVAAEKALFGKVDGILFLFTVPPLFWGFVGWLCGGRRGLAIGAFLGALMSFIMLSDIVAVRRGRIRQEQTKEHTQQSRPSITPRCYHLDRIRPCSSSVSDPSLESPHEVRHVLS
jgi:hypothetical protein